MGKRILGAAIACVMALSSSVYAMAAPANPRLETNQTVTVLENGDRITETVTVERSLYRGARVTDTAHKTVKYNTADGLMWTFTISGSFTWDGSTAKASNASYDYDIYGNWSFKSGSASASGASVKGKGTFKSVWGTTKTTEPVLTCSPNGDIR